MAYRQLQKPANQSCNNETAHWPMKHHGEHKQSDYNVVKCQTQCQTEKYAQHQHGYGSGTHGYANSHRPGTYAYPNGHGGAYPNGHGTATCYPLNGHLAVTPGHSSGQMVGTYNSQHYGHGAGAAGHRSYGTAACYSKNEKGHRKMHDGTYRRKKRHGECDGSSSESESDDESYRCP